VLAAAAVVAAGAACGGEEPADEAVAPAETGATFTATSPAVTEDLTETRPDPPADQSLWARKVDAACKPWQKRLDALEPPADPSGLGPFLAESLPLIRKEIAAIEAVRPPTGSEEASQVEAFVANLRRIERALTAYGAAVESNDRAAVETALGEVAAAGAETRALAFELGVTECGGYSGG
jgi:hypothetical protein